MNDVRNCDSALVYCDSALYDFANGRDDHDAHGDPPSFFRKEPPELQVPLEPLEPQGLAELPGLLAFWEAAEREAGCSACWRSSSAASPAPTPSSVTHPTLSSYTTVDALVDGLLCLFVENHKASLSFIPFRHSYRGHLVEWRAVAHRRRARAVRSRLNDRSVRGTYTNGTTAQQDAV